MKYLSAFFATVSMFAATQANAEISVTAYGGQTMSQELVTTKQQSVDIKDSSHFAISVDKHNPTAKYGLFYATSSADLRNQPNKSLDLEYLMFQSAVILPIKENVSGYLGAQIGVNRIAPDFTDSDSFFASGLFGGLQYEVSDNVFVGGEVRWLATIVKNTSSVECDTADNNEGCIWHFDGDVLNQFQTSFNLTYRF